MKRRVIPSDQAYFHHFDSHEDRLVSFSSAKIKQQEKALYSNVDKLIAHLLQAKCD